MLEAIVSASLEGSSICLKKDPKERASVIDLLNHHWIQQSICQENHIQDYLADLLDIMINNISNENYTSKAPANIVEQDRINLEKEENSDELANLKELGIEVIYTGALFSTYQKSRIEKLCNEVGLKAISPFWHKDPREYMELVLSSGFKVIIGGVYAEGLDKSWLGKEIDRVALDDLIKISEKTYLHLAFEGGEAETLVVDGPIFKKRIEIIDSKIDWHRDSGNFHVLDAKLVDK